MIGWDVLTWQGLFKFWSGISVWHSQIVCSLCMHLFSLGTPTSCHSLKKNVFLVTDTLNWTIHVGVIKNLSVIFGLILGWKNIFSGCFAPFTLTAWINSRNIFCFGLYLFIYFIIIYFCVIVNKHALVQMAKHKVIFGSLIILLNLCSPAVLQNGVSPWLFLLVQFLPLCTLSE